MDCTKLIENFKGHGFSARYFDTAAEAVAYLRDSLKGEVVSFGGSTTLNDIGLYDELKQNNTVYWHWKNPDDIKRFAEYTTYITSANAVSETGELVNIDGRGNRISASVFGSKKLFFVCGINKIAPDLPAAIFRARNVAAPLNAKRLKHKTPCAETGRCHDCSSPERLCRNMSIYMRPMTSFDLCEVIIIGENLGF